MLAAGSVLDERAYPGNAECRELVTGGRGYEVADGSDPGPLPAWLAALAAGAEPVARPGGRKGARAAPGARLQGLVTTVRAGQEGDRNGPLYWAARRVAEMIAAGEVDRGTAEESSSPPRSRRACAAGSAKRAGRSPRRCGEPACEPGPQPGRGQATR